MNYSEDRLQKLTQYRATVGYRGSNFCGFARQPECLTVQGDIENALKVITKQDTLTTCAGRTDAGVHARGQVISFGSEFDNLDSSRFLRSINALTHDDIVIFDCIKTNENFNARFDAKSREYRYFIHNQMSESIFCKDFSWHISKPLNVGKMKKASQYLIGEHDFKSFCMAISAKDKPTCRNISNIEFSIVNNWGEELTEIRIEGNAFLHSMVRTIVGTLVMVGKENCPVEWVKEVLLARDRRAAGENAPANGLVFWSVKY